MRVAVQNAADREQVGKAGERDNNRRNQDLDDLRRILSSDFGRRFLYRLLEITGVYQTSFTGNSETFFREGQRSVGLHIIKEIEEADKRGFIAMLAERMEQKNG